MLVVADLLVGLSLLQATVDATVVDVRFFEFLNSRSIS